MKQYFFTSIMSQLTTKKALMLKSRKFRYLYLFFDGNLTGCMNFKRFQKASNYYIMSNRVIIRAY